MGSVNENARAGSSSRLARASGRFNGINALGRLALGVTLATSGVHGAPADETPSEEKALDPSGTQRLFEIKTGLESGDQAQVLTALSRLAAEKHPSFVPPLLALLRRGGSEPVIRAAFDAAGEFGDSSLSQGVAPYLQHRLARVRHAAAQTLAKTGGGEAARPLRHALRAEDARLRELAAAALGDVGDISSVPDLFLALDHGIAVAAISLGKLCDDQSCFKLIDRLGKVPFEAMSEGLAALLLRADGSVKPSTKVEVIARIANLQTDSALSLLRGTRSRWPEKADPAVTNALDNALDSFGAR